MKTHKFCGGKIEVKSKGLVVNLNFPYLEASVDGYVTCSICGGGIVVFMALMSGHGKT